MQAPMAENSNRTWGQLHAELWPGLVRALSAANGGYAHVEDAIQEAFAQALSGRAPAELRSPEAWLFTVALNELRRHRRRSTWSLRTAAEPAHADGIDEAIQRISVLRTLARLPARDRQLLVAKYYVGLTQNEIASAMGLRQGTVASAIARAARRFRDFENGEDQR
jgi:RNA polymerase sigma factor (sigma-70 family)